MFDKTEPCELLACRKLAAYQVSGIDPSFQNNDKRTKDRLLDEVQSNGHGS
jgi:hypothetical protein